jgi:hypothetical protein
MMSGTSMRRNRTERGRGSGDSRGVCAACYAWAHGPQRSPSGQHDSMCNKPTTSFDQKNPKRFLCPPLFAAAAAPCILAMLDANSCAFACMSAVVSRTSLPQRSSGRQAGRQPSRADAQGESWCTCPPVGLSNAEHGKAAAAGAAGSAQLGASGQCTQARRHAGGAGRRQRRASQPHPSFSALSCNMRLASSACAAAPFAAASASACLRVYCRHPAHAV